MELRRLFAVLGRRWYLVALAAIITATAAWYTWRLLPSEYEATALLHIPTPPVGADWFQYDHSHSDRMINFYLTLGESRTVQESLLNALNTTDLPGYTVEPIPNSGLIRIAAKGSTPEAAAVAANELSRILIDLDEGLPESRDPSLAPTLRLVEAAIPPEEPAGPGLPLVVILATVVGALLGLLLVIIVENLDQRLHFIDDISAIAARPVLAAVPRSGHRRNSLASSDSVQGRAYRRLRAQLISRVGDDMREVVVVTAPQPGQGVSTTVVNLAAVLAATGRRVLIVDCAGTRSELTEKLLAKDRQLNSVKKAFGGTSLARASSPLNDVRLITTTAASVPTVLSEIDGHVDSVLIDVGSMADSMNLMTVAPVAAAVVLVVRLGSVTGPVLADARDQLRSVGANFLGVVVTSSHANGYRPRGAQDSEPQQSSLPKPLASASD